VAQSELAGKIAPAHILVNVPRLVAAYYTTHPDPDDPAQRVSFGTSGHRGSSLDGTFTEDHLLAICQAISEERAAHGVEGPLFLGMDTHALSEAAFRSAVEVFAGNDVELRIDEHLGYTATPVVSHAILGCNRGRTDALGDGVVVTPSHNPPADGGLKYNPPTGGPADTDTTRRIQDRANELLAGRLRGVRRIPFERALRAGRTIRHDFTGPYVEDLANVVEMDAIARSGIRVGIDPMGGASLPLWEPIAHRYGLELTVVNARVDPTFSFMTVDHDGKIRMDCSSPFAMAGLIGLRGQFDIAFGNDPDADRHGIVTPSSGLMNPNHFLAAAVRYLFTTRADWAVAAAVGKTLVSSSLIDRIAAQLGRPLLEVPVGFKWFVDGLLDGSLGFAGEESAGASFLRRDGRVWTTDKDGIILGLLAAEMTAVSGKDPGEHYDEIAEQLGRPVYARVDAPATPAQKAVLASLSPEMVDARELAGETIREKLTRAPANGAAIGGLKVVAENGWFAARPSGTENVYKIYAESFKDERHLDTIVAEAQSIVTSALSLGDRAS